MTLVTLFEEVKKNLIYWSSINIHEDLELQTINPDSKDVKTKIKSGNEPSIWIRDKRRNKGLEVQLEPMVVKWPKMYPIGNYIDPTEINDENKKFHTFDAKKLEEAKYQLKFVPEDYENGYIGTHERGRKCLEWLQELERWFMEQCFHHPEIWVKEKNDLRMKVEEEMLDDYPEGNIPPEKFEKKYKSQFLRSFKSKIDYQVKDGEKQKDKPMRFNITENVYKSYPQKNHDELIEKNNVQFTDQEKKWMNQKTDPLFKQIFPLLDSHGNIIPQEDAIIQNNDVVSARLKFKKKNKPTPGLGFKLISLQLVRQYNIKDRKNTNVVDEGPIDFGDFGTEYKRRKMIEYNEK